MKYDNKMATHELRQSESHCSNKKRRIDSFCDTQILLSGDHQIKHDLGTSNKCELDSLGK